MIKMHQWKDYKLKRKEKRNHVLGHVNNFEQKKAGKRLRKALKSTCDAMLTCIEKLIVATLVQTQFPVKGIKPQETSISLSNKSRHHECHKRMNKNSMDANTHGKRVLDLVSNCAANR